tara:strand:- start:2915 stop:3223 length:309 start_codon:yes stop_codon:yes gene_type:complete
MSKIISSFDAKEKAEYDRYIASKSSIIVRKIMKDRRIKARGDYIPKTSKEITAKYAKTEKGRAAQKRATAKYYAKQKELRRLAKIERLAKKEMEKKFDWEKP